MKTLYPHSQQNNLRKQRTTMKMHPVPCSYGEWENEINTKLYLFIDDRIRKAQLLRNVVYPIFILSTKKKDLPSTSSFLDSINFFLTLEQINKSKTDRLNLINSSKTLVFLLLFTILIKTHLFLFCLHSTLPN